MDKESNNHLNVFHMSLGKPLFLAVMVPVLGVSLSAWLYLARPMYFGVWLPIVVLILSVLGIYQGMMMPTKLEIRGREIVIYYLSQKRIVSVDDIAKYFLDEEKAGRGAVSGSRSFVTLQLTTGGKINFKNIKEGNQPFLKSLESWTGLESTSKNDFIFHMSKEHPTVENISDDVILPVELSIKTEELIQKLFPPSEHDEIRQFLIKHGNDLYPEFLNKDQLEDIRLKALKKSRGNLKKLHVEIAWLSPK